MDGEKRYFDDVIKSKERLLDVTTEVASGSKNMLILLNENYDDEALQTLKNYFSNYCSDEELIYRFNDNLEA